MPIDLPNNNQVLLAYRRSKVTTIIANSPDKAAPAPFSIRSGHSVEVSLWIYLETIFIFQEQILICMHNLNLPGQERKELLACVALRDSTRDRHLPISGFSKVAVELKYRFSIARGWVI